MKKKWNLFNISEARSITLGFATIIIAFFHCFKYNFENILPNKIGQICNFILKTSNVGVDLFLLLSGLGLYFSFSKNSDIKEFYKKRILRIIPAIIIVATIYFLHLRVGILDFLKGITLTAFFIDGKRDFWYFALIISLYLIYPFIHKIIEKHGIKGLLILIIISVVSTVLLLFFGYDLYKKIEIALTRIPSFLVGVYLGKQVLNKKNIPEYSMSIFFLIFLLCNFILFSVKFKYYICVRYLGCILGISILFLISYIHSKIKFNLIEKVLTFIGFYSMEIYLLFEKLCVETIKAQVFNIKNYFIFYTAMFGITLVFSILLNKICKRINDLFKSKKAS